MKKWILSLLVVFFGLHAQIFEVRDMAEVMCHFDGSGEWALFDIDLVLVQPIEPAFQMPNFMRHIDIARTFMDELSQEELSLLLCLMPFASGSELVDEQLHSYLGELERLGVPTMALTANLTGAGGGIDSIPEAKLDVLNSLGIDFSQTAPHPGMIVFDQFPEFVGGYPLLRQGVLFANGGSCKGDVFLAFLEEVGCVPAKIVFIDDRRKNLEDVEQALEKAFPETAFVGLHYTGATHLPCMQVTADTFEARLRELHARIVDY